MKRVKLLRINRLNPIIFMTADRHEYGEYTDYFIDNIHIITKQNSRLALIVLGEPKIYKHLIIYISTMEEIKNLITKETIA